MDEPRGGIRLWHRVAAALAASLVAIPALTGVAFTLADIDTVRARAAAVDSVRRQHDADTRQIRRQIRSFRLEVLRERQETNRKLDCLLFTQGVGTEDRCRALIEAE